jgi:protein arginine kinase activator
MICQACQKNLATVHVTEIISTGNGNAPGSHEILDKHICPSCAQQMDLPHMQVVSKKMADIWKLLQQSSKKTRREASLACSDCGMTLGEFRSKGRLGCPKDYEVFRDHLDALLVRMHNADSHVGRGPGVNEFQLERMQRINSLREKLDEAVRSEAYEHAARLRDELKGLQGDGGS